jgi:hypothetical protein
MQTHKDNIHDIIDSTYSKSHHVDLAQVAGYNDARNNIAHMVIQLSKSIALLDGLMKQLIHYVINLMI